MFQTFCSILMLYLATSKLVYIRINLSYGIISIYTLSRIACMSSNPLFLVYDESLYEHH